MAHFAQLDNDNNVIQVIVVSDNKCNGGVFPESEEAGIAFCKSLLGEDTVWKQTSYNSNFRAAFAGIGMRYNEDLDIFENG